MMGDQAQAKPLLLTLPLEIRTHILGLALPDAIEADVTVISNEWPHIQSEREETQSEPEETQSENEEIQNQLRENQSEHEETQSESEGTQSERDDNESEQSDNVDSFVWWNDWRGSKGLFLACHQLHDEAEPIFYSRLEISVYTERYECFEEICDAFSQRAKASITQLTVEWDGEDSGRGSKAPRLGWKQIREWTVTHLPGIRTLNIAITMGEMIIYDDFFHARWPFWVRQLAQIRNLRELNVRFEKCTRKDAEDQDSQFRRSLNAIFNHLTSTMVDSAQGSQNLESLKVVWGFSEGYTVHMSNDIDRHNGMLISTDEGGSREEKIKRLEQQREQHPALKEGLLGSFGYIQLLQADMTPI